MMCVDGRRTKVTRRRGQNQSVRGRMKESGSRRVISRALTY